MARMRSYRAIALLLLLAAAAAPSALASGRGLTEAHAPEVRVGNKRLFLPLQAYARVPVGEQPGGKPKPNSNGISYHGGPVMLGTVNMYYIYYGAKWDAASQSILNFFGNTIGGSSWYNIQTSYTSGSGVRLSNSVALRGSASVGSPYDNALSDSQIQQVVSNALTSGALTTDPNGVYFVLTSPEVTASSGFCTSYCGWHTSATLNGQNIKYSFVGNPARCPSSCSAQAMGPNGDTGVDGMISVIAHELAEAATDPNLNAWYDTRGYENADKCAWNFGATSTAANGAAYNVVLSDGSTSMSFLIQLNWVNAAGGYCAVSY